MDVRNEARVLKEFKEIPTRLFLMFADARHEIMVRFHKDVVVDNIWRSKLEQKEICKKAKLEYYDSPHMDYRGLDFFIKNGTEKEHKFIEAYVCDKYPYGKPGYVSCLYHDIGLGSHIHLQVKPKEI